ncbi:hypothetical protein [Rhodopila sp.]|uniref:hypothetical protein n=1 Tax=Rhodopila sp. TaxID=2480087 RepID=UPI003D1102DE
MNMDDAALRAELANPGALPHAERRAKAAVDASRARGRLAGQLDAIYQHAVATLDRSRPHPMAPQTHTEAEVAMAHSVARLWMAYAVTDAFGWLASQPDQVIGPVLAATGENRPAAARALCQRHQTWAAWSDSFDERCRQIDAANARQAADQHAAFRAAAPATAVAAAELTGIVLTLDKAGTSILAPAGHAIPEAVLADLAEYKPGVIAHLTARAATVIVA